MTNSNTPIDDNAGGGLVFHQKDALQFFLIFDPSERSLTDFVLADTSGRTSSVNIDRVATSYSNQVLNSDFSEHIPIPWGQYHGGVFAPVDVNFSRDFATEDTNIAYVYIGPDTTEAIVVHSVGKGVETCFVVESGRQYALSGYFATHRCSAKFVIMFRDADNNYISHEVVDVEPDIPGGTKIELYQRVGIISIAPTGARLACVRIVARRTITEQNAFLFFARIWFGKCLSRKLPDWCISPFDLLAPIFKTPPTGLVSVLVNVPIHYLDGESHKFEIVDQISGQTVRGSPIVIQRKLQVSGKITGVESNIVFGTIILDSDLANDLEIELLVDGETIDGGIAGGNSASKTFQMALPSNLLDGQPHVIAVALKSTGQVVARFASIVPTWSDDRDVTLKKSVQQIFNHPSILDTSRFQRLLDHLDRHETSTSAISSKRLFDNLRAGPDRKRSTYVPVVFPKPSNPEVSIILRTFGDLERTYLVLNSLALVVSHVAFEVILVHDSSSTENELVDCLATGIKVIRQPLRTQIAHYNTAIQIAIGCYIVFIDINTEVTSNWLDELMLVFKNFEGVGLVGAKQLDSNGDFHSTAGAISSNGRRLTPIQGNNSFAPDTSYVREFEYFFKFPIMLRRSTWNTLGGFSPGFTSLHLGLADLCLSLRSKELKVLFAAQSIVFRHPSGLNDPMERDPDPGDDISMFNTKWITTFCDTHRKPSGSDRPGGKDITLNALVVDIKTPNARFDDNHYAAVQEMRLLQSLGFKIKFVAANLEYDGQNTAYLQRLGIEVVYAPFIDSVENLLRKADFDLVFFRSYDLLRQTLPMIRTSQLRAKIMVNVTDLQYVYEERLRGHAPQLAGDAPRSTLLEDEFRILSAADLNVSYYGSKDQPSAFVQDIEIKRFPLVMEFPPDAPNFDKRKDIGIVCSPNNQSDIETTTYFIENIWPLLKLNLKFAGLYIFVSPTPRISQFKSSTRCKVTVCSGYYDIERAIERVRVMILPPRFQTGVHLDMGELFAAGIPIIVACGGGRPTPLGDRQYARDLLWPPDLVRDITERYTKKETYVSNGLEECVERYHNFDDGAEIVKSLMSRIGLSCARNRKHVYSLRAYAGTSESASGGFSGEVLDRRGEP